MIDNSTLITEQNWPNETIPVISIFNWVFNHKDFIRESIESILMQKTTFPVEIIIHDDASNDGTREIILEYKDKYPKLFRNVLHEENQWSQGKSVMTALFEKPRGKYIALTHGDDYWSDPLKLQKQVDFLETHPDFAICDCRTKMLYENDPDREAMEGAGEGIYTIEDLAESNFIPTSSVLFRQKYLKELPSWFGGKNSYDWALFLCLAQHGKIKMFDSVMSVHRLHKGGIWTKHEINGDWHYHLEISIKTLAFLRTKFNSEVNNKLSRNYFNAIFKLCKIHLNNKDYVKFREVSKYLSEIPIFNSSVADVFFNSIALNMEHKEEELLLLKQLVNDLKESTSYKIGNALVKMGKIVKPKS